MTHSPEWSAVGWTMLHFLWVGTALGLMMAIGRRALRLRSPDAQYVYAVVCLAILAVTPIGIGTWIFWD